MSRGGFLLISLLYSVGAAHCAPMPPGYSCVGFCGTLGANGDVPLAPTGNPAYMFVASAGNGAFLGGVLPTGMLGTEKTGSRATSAVFSAGVGSVLKFYFNYVTSDGAGYADYGWSALLNSDNSVSAVLFTARTVASGSIVPGTAMPTPVASLSPMSVPISPGTTWAPLAEASGTCWDAGCGNTGWVEATYVIPVAGSYKMAFGATNWNDTGFQSGLAFDGLMLDGEPVGTVPEPSGALLLPLAAGLLIWARRRGIPLVSDSSRSSLL